MESIVSAFQKSSMQKQFPPSEQLKQGIEFHLSSVTNLTVAIFLFTKCMWK